MQIRNLLFHFDAGPNPDPAFHFDADSDPDPGPTHHFEQILILAST
jgi:hypothetical protein